MASAVRPFLAAHCFGCHNADALSAGLDLRALATAARLDTDRERWESVLRKLASGEMPLKNAPPPSDTDRVRVIDWLESEFDRLDAAAEPDPAASPRGV